MDTNKYINLMICMGIGVVILTSLAVPVMTLHESRQETFDNATDYIEAYGIGYSIVSPMDGIEFHTSSSDFGKFIFNGDTYDISDIPQMSQYYMPIILCDAGYISAKQTSETTIAWEFYLYSSEIESDPPFISDYVWRQGNVYQYQSDTNFEIDFVIEDGQMTMDYSDGPGMVTQHIESPVRLFTYGYDPDGDYIARGGHYLYPISWRAGDIRWIDPYNPGSAYENGTTVAWNPDITNPVTNFQTKDMGGGVVQQEGAMTVTYELDGETITSQSTNPTYYIVPTEVLGDKIQGVDNPSIIAIVAVIPLIIAVSLVLWLCRNIFSRE